ncbi:hypothetical protein [Aquabacterium sp.]|uniref:hypothetical protein n=1 Tax=Aquabacterium sp. TaxID=1872578 RepID=UPI002B713064|nr:hypothetical protein [Aquabacterium sp.]HSW09184.1 hypothetical protein [Aquabacterium sp.]
MKHFPQFIHMLRAAWDGDRNTCVEQATHLAERLESEGDTAHARMLRFTLSALQNKEMSPATRQAVADARATMLAPAPTAAGTQDDAGRVALTFGEWEHEAAPHR